MKKQRLFRNSTLNANIANINADKMMNRVNELGAQQKWDDCINLCEKQKTRPVPKVLLAGINAKTLSREDMENVLQETILREIPRLEKFLSTLGMLVAIAPLLGLLGTVTGMINTFHVITFYGTGDPKMMSEGISEALTTTMLGLGVAIPIMLFYTFLSRNKDIIRDEAKQYVLKNRFPDINRYRGLRALFVFRFLERRCGESGVDKYILDETVMSMVSSFDKYLACIGILAAVSPLFGLLGTVIGMVITFDIISIFGTGNARAMAGGISQALITTQTGLLVAIPGFYMRNFLSGRAENLKHRIASTGIYLKRYVKN